MNHLRFLLLISIVMMVNLSCTKTLTNVKTVPITAITVVNAVVNANPVISDFSGVGSVSVYFSTSQQVGFGAFYEYSVPSGSTVVVVHQISDTSVPFYKNILNLQPAAIYSLFLSGSDTTHIDTLLTLDDLPYHAGSDSTASIRFVNLSTGSEPISVNIQGNSNGSEVNSLAYQAITNFKNYPASQNISQYNFEFRDVSSGVLLTTFTYNVVPFQNITIAVIGSESPGALTPISAMQINNF
jgi:hypothetical protein